MSAGARYALQTDFILGLRLWNVADGTLVRTLTAYAGFIWNVALSPDDRTVTAAIEFWDQQHADPLGQQALRLWDAESGALTLTIPDLGQSEVLFSPDGQALISASNVCCDRTLVARSASDGSLLTIPSGNPVPGIGSIAFVGDGDTVASHRSDYPDNSIQLWNLTDGSLVVLPQEPTTGSKQLAASVDRTRLAAVIGEGTQVRIWDTIDRAPITTLIYGQPVTALAFSPDGQTLAAGVTPSSTSGANIVTLRVADGTAVGTPLVGHTAVILALAFAPDGSVLASGGADATIRFWSTVDGSLLKILDEETGLMPGSEPSQGVRSIVFSSDGERIVYGRTDATLVVARNPVVPRLAQTITFDPLPDRTLTESPLTVSAEASSGLPVSFSAAGGCTAAGASVMLVSVGTCTITASQPGNTDDHAAPDVPRSFSVVPPSHMFTVTLTGTGTGSVSSAPAGIACPTACEKAFLSGTVVTLTATLAAGSVFTGWSGACIATPCTVTMAAARAVTATFAPNAPDLIETSVSNPPWAVLPGAAFSATDTVRNQGGVAAAASTTRYYLSLDAVKDTADRLLSGTRAVPGLAAGGTSTGSTMVTTPSNMALGSYFLIGCADNTSTVPERDESNNCRASAGIIRVTRPDLVVTALSPPPATIVRGGRIAVTDSVLNQEAVLGGASTNRYYLSANPVHDAGDRLLTGTRAVPALPPSATSTGTVSVTVAANMTLGMYYLIACADNTTTVIEKDETNNCRASATMVQVTMP